MNRFERARARFAAAQADMRRAAGLFDCVPTEARLAELRRLHAAIIEALDESLEQLDGAEARPEGCPNAIADHAHGREIERLAAGVERRFGDRWA